MLEMLTGVDLSPAPINGFVTTRQFADAHQRELLKLLNGWFKIVNYVNTNEEDAAKIMVDELNKASAANFTIDDFTKFWQHYEHYPLNPAEVQRDILSLSGKNYWRNRWDDDNNYFFGTIHSIPKPVPPEGVFWMEKVHQDYITAYGSR